MMGMSFFVEVEWVGMGLDGAASGCPSCPLPVYAASRSLAMISISASSVSINSSDFTFRTSLPALNRIPWPSPPAMPMSASLPSPIPLTTQPSTDTVSGTRTWPSRFSISLASLTTSIYAPAGRTGDDVHPPVTQIEGLQNLEADLDLFHRIGRQ